MRVLVIDDDPDVRTLCRLNLTWDGHEIIEAAAGAEGLALVLSEAPDAVLLDVMMPNIDGIQVLHRIRQTAQTADLPVVLMSARVRVEDQIEGLAAGADDYIKKPFAPSDLSEALEGANDLDPMQRRAGRAARVERLRADAG
jgi:two-component system response regulator MprA